MFPASPPASLTTASDVATLGRNSHPVNRAPSDVVMFSESYVRPFDDGSATYSLVACTMLLRSGALLLHAMNESTSRIGGMYLLMRYNPDRDDTPMLRSSLMVFTTL